MARCIFLRTFVALLVFRFIAFSGLLTAQSSLWVDYSGWSYVEAGFRYVPYGSIVQDIVMAWGVTQHGDLETQFYEGGVRVFDIRLADSRKPGVEQIAFNHYPIYFGDENYNIGYLFSTIKRLLQDNPEDIIILNFTKIGQV